MERSKNHIELGREFHVALAGGKIPYIDFDRLVKWIDECLEVLERHGRYEIENDHLRQDLIERIGGMAKAIAVADRSRRSLSEAIEFVNQLNHFSAEELTGAYRRTAARFRDSFPGSFASVPAMVPQSSSSLGKKHNR